MNPGANQNKLDTAIRLLEEVMKSLGDNSRPVCSEPAVRDLDLQIAFPKMRESEAKFAVSLLKGGGEVVTDDELCEETGLNLNSIKVYACCCRTHFYDSGISPSIIRVRHIGYRIAPDAIRAISQAALG